MKRSITSKTLGILATLSAVAPTALVLYTAAAPQVSAATRTAYTPHTLVHAAYNGRLEGIPSFALLKRAVALRQVRAEDVIEAAISQGRLSEERLEDRAFRSAVRANLRGLNDNL